VKKVSTVLLLVFAVAFQATAQIELNNKAQELYEKGEKALANKEYFKAQAHYTECLRINPRYAEAYRSRAIAREYLGEYAKALTDFNIYVDLRPEDAEALFNRAVLRFEAKQHHLARQDFLNLLAMPAGNTNTVYYSQEKYGNSDSKIHTAQTGMKDHVCNFLGQIETHFKRHAIAIQWLDTAISIDPTNAVYYVNRGIAHAERGDKIKATADYEQALKLDPSNSLALHNLSAMKSLSGETADAERLLTESIEKNSKLPYPRAERAYQRMQKGDLKGALEDYDEVVKLEPKEEENYLNRGLVKEKLKDLQGALADFSQAIKLNEENPRAWVCRGNVVSKMSNWKEAIEDYTVALSLDKTYGMAHYNRGICYQNLGKHTEACTDLKAALKLGVTQAEKVIAKLCK